MEHEEFMRFFMTFMKKHGAFGKFLSETYTPLPLRKLMLPTDKNLTNKQRGLVLTLSMDWDLTKQGWGFWHDLNQQFNEEYTKTIGENKPQTESATSLIERLYKNSIYGSYNFYDSKNVIDYFEHLAANYL